MKVAIVHYHLEPGGVTSVIENTLDSFTQHSKSIQPVVLSGRPYSGNKIKNYQVVNGLDYTALNSSLSAKSLKDKMETAAIMGLGGKPDLWHIHNHSLGKNSALTGAVAILAEEKKHLLLHPHDFAEDGRPSNFNLLREVYSKTYPCSAHVHYATLNHRDFSFVSNLLKESSSQVHLLANSIGIPPVIEENDKNIENLPSNLFLYPVRAVRRKNLGEIALIASAYPEKYFANSLGPTNPNYVSQFNRWKEFTKYQKLPVSFALGEEVECSFLELINHAEGIISTSVAEGFGLGFLEPWMFEKFMCGRNIAEITQDFSNLGIHLDNLYNRIDIDLKHLHSTKALKLKIESALKQYFAEYGKEVPKGSTNSAYKSIVNETGADFGRLDESLQEEIIYSVLKSKSAQEEIRSQVDIQKVDLQIIQKNKSAIMTNFAQKNYAQNVERIYKLLVNSTSEPIQYANGEKLLNSFLSPTRFNLLRTS